MKWHINKMIVLATFSLLVGNASTWSSEGSPNNKKQQCYGPCESKCGCLSIYLDALFWKARGSNVNYVDNFNYSNGSFIFNNRNNQGLLVSSNTKSLNYDCDVGFRLGAGYDFTSSGWNLSFLWTHFKTKADGSNGPVSQFVDQFETSFSSTVYGVAAHWKLDVDYWDFSLGRQFCISECIAVHPYLGVRGLQTVQKYCSDSIFNSTLDISQSKSSLSRQVLGPIVTETHLDINGRYKFVGFGPRVGVDIATKSWCGLGLYGQAALSGIVGYEKRSNKVTNATDLRQIIESFASQPRQLEVGANDIQNQLIDVQNHKLQANRAMVDFGIGIYWQPDFCMRWCQSFAVSLGWEYHVIFGQKDLLFDEGRVITESFVDAVGVTNEMNLDNVQVLPPASAGKCNSTLGLHGIVLSFLFSF